ncbi:MAG: MBL fold metallo-hydrolase [Spirochaetes bacterium]|nr:MAG: MBL fold metallo-hydrolase [Spirochaetota bacterium]
MKILSQVHLVGGAGESAGSDAAIYLIKGDGGAALVDAGTGESHDRVLKNIAAAGVKPNEIGHLFLTHCHYDHTGGADRMRGATGCAIVAHELDAEFLEMGDSRVTAASWYGTHMEPFGIDIKVTEEVREFVIGGIQVTFHHAPGHSPGSAILTMVSDGKLVLFGQDVHGPLNGTLRSNRGDYVKSLEYMLALDADILCEGHFGVFTGKDKVRDFIESYL